MPKIKIRKPAQRTAASQSKKMSTDDKPSSQVKTLVIKPYPRTSGLKKIAALGEPE